MNKTILIIDDEPQMIKIIQIILKSNNYNVLYSQTSKDGILSVAMNNPDCILLDLSLPDEDGIKTLKKLREWYKKPIIILSVRNSEKDIVSALDSGADDYLTKPFNSSELLARIRTSFRHYENRNTEEYIFKTNDITVDLSLHTVKKGNKIIKMTSKEYDILVLLINNYGKLLTHKYILENIWGHSFINDFQYLRVYISQIRKKIEDDPNNPLIILTESGLGYRLV